jgi:HSP20 family protein
MATFDEDWRKKRNRNPFDFFGNDDEFESIFRQMERMWERAFQDFSFDKIEPGKSFIHGYSINIGPDGKPKIQEFGHRPHKTVDGDHTEFDEREPLTDLIEGDEYVSITVEIPGVVKNDIDLKVTEKAVEITVNDHNRRYHKLIELPCDVLPEESKATYNNGVLDVNIKRKERKKDDEGYHVNIE